jgi:hypothetical protein
MYTVEILNITLENAVQKGQVDYQTSDVDSEFNVMSRPS